MWARRSGVRHGPPSPLVWWAKFTWENHGWQFRGLTISESSVDAFVERCIRDRIQYDVVELEEPAYLRGHRVDNIEVKGELL